MDPRLDVALVAKGGFLEFVRVTYEQLEKRRFQEAEYHRTLCHVLQRQWQDPFADTLINIPPGHTKSSLLTLLTLWGWVQDPKHRFSFGSVSPALGKREGGKIVALVNSAWWKARWSHLSFVDEKGADAKDPSTSTLWTSAGGMRFSCTPRSASIGWHFHTQLYDDLHKPNQLTKVELLRVDAWLTETMPARWLPGRRNRIVAMQRLHVSDACATIETQATLTGAAPLTRVVLPLEYDPTLAKDLRLSEEETAFDHRKAEGEILDPVRFDVRTVAIQKAQLVTASARSAQLGQRVSAAAGKVWRREWFKVWRELPATFDKIVDVWDLSFDDEGVDPDYVAGHRWGKAGTKLYLICKVPTIRRDFVATRKAIVAFRESEPAYRPDGIVIERKANGPAIMSSLRDAVPGLIGFEPVGSKVQRASAAAVSGEAGDVYVGPEHGDVVEYCVGFPALAKDDDVDVVSMAILYLTGGRAGMPGEEALERFAALLGAR